jgi:Domain of Unknown Function (DUF1259)
MKCAIVLFGLIVLGAGPGVAPAADPDWKAVEQALGKSGQLQPGDVFRVGMPRADLAVTVKGVPVKAGFALGSYAAFKQMGDRAMVMGDLVLLDQEVPAVMSGLFSGGLEVKQIEQSLGRQGRDIGGGVYQVTVPRAEAITEMGQPLLPAMGVVTVMNFQPTADGKAAITGDFVLVDKEVNAVAKTLRQHGIDVTAIHNHGLMDTPRLFYMHFWANDDAAKLAQGLRAALDQTNSTKVK